jgi:hypothetical protein
MIMENITMNRAELKALMKEAFKEAMLETLNDSGKEKNGSHETERDKEVAKMLENHLVQYRKVWEALA